MPEPVKKHEPSQGSSIIYMPPCTYILFRHFEVVLPTVSNFLVRGFQICQTSQKILDNKKIKNKSSGRNKTCFLETIEEFLRFYLQGWKHPFLIILVCLPVAHVSVNYSDTPGKTNMDAEHGRVPWETNDSKIRVRGVYATMYFYPQIVTASGFHILNLSRSFLPKRVEIRRYLHIQDLCQQDFQVSKLPVLTQIYAV